MAGETRAGKVERATNIAINAGVLAFLVYAALGPRGPVRASLVHWREERATRANFLRVWPELAQQATATNRPVLYEFTDYECPFCRSMHRVVEAVRISVGAIVVPLHVPRAEIHAFAENAAKAAICSEEQGVLVSMHAYLNTSRDWMVSHVDWGAVALAGSVPDTTAFRDCLQSSRPKERLVRDRRLADALGVGGTPTYVSRRGLHRGSMSDADLRAFMTGGTP